MKIIPDKEVKRKRVKRPRPEPKIAPVKDGQTAAIEAIGAEIKELIQANAKNASILLEIIRKVKTDVQLVLPKQLEPEKRPRKWRHTLEQGYNGKATEIISEVIG